MRESKKETKNGKGITLVLSGGGARGMAHIGVLEVFEENKIPIKRVVGTSAGALVGGFYAAGKLGEIKKFFLALSKFDAFRLFFSFPSIRSIFSCKRLDSILEKSIGGLKIENLRTPFTAVAFDISKGKKRLFKKGDLFDAIRSSIAVPGFFRPYQLGDSILVDGGVTDIVPVDAAKEYSRSSRIVAVNLETHPVMKIDKFNLLRILDAAAYFELRELSELQEKEADVVIHPNVNIGRFAFHRAKEAIAEGRRAASGVLPKIRKLIRASAD